MSTLDPIKFEVIRNALVEATEEMSIARRRSAYSTKISPVYHRGECFGYVANLAHHFVIAPGFCSLTKLRIIRHILYNVSEATPQTAKAG